MLNIFFFFFFPTCGFVLKNSSRLLEPWLITDLLTASLTPVQCWANLLWSILASNKYTLESIKTVCEFGFEAFSNFSSSRALGKMDCSICLFIAPKPLIARSWEGITGKRILSCSWPLLEAGCWVWIAGPTAYSLKWWDKALPVWNPKTFYENDDSNLSSSLLHHEHPGGTA